MTHETITTRSISSLLRDCATAIAERLRAGDAPGYAYCRGIRTALRFDERPTVRASSITGSARWQAIDSEMAWSARVAGGDRPRYLAFMAGLVGLARASGADATIIYLPEGAVRTPTPLEEPVSPYETVPERRWRVAAGRTLLAAA